MNSTLAQIPHRLGTAIQLLLIEGRCLLEQRNCIRLLMSLLIQTGQALTKRHPTR